MGKDNFKNEFPILQKGDKHYLDTAATSQKPKVVIDNITEYYEKYNGNPGRGSHEFSIMSSSIVKASRIRVKEFINSSLEEEIIFTKNTTEALNIIAYCYGLEKIKRGDEILIGISNHHSNLVTWQYVAKKTGATLKYIYLDKNGQLDLNDMKYKVSEKTKIVSISTVVNTTGVIQPFEEVIEIAHKKGAIVILDAAQSILHFRHDVQKWDADFLVFSGHKMFSGMGVGVLYGKKELLDSMPPFIYGGDMVEYVEEQKTTYAPLPQKFEGGTLNVEAIGSLKTAIEYIEEISYKRIAEVENSLMLQTMFELNQLDFIETYYTETAERIGVIAFNVKEVHSHDVAFILDSYGVAVRSGQHCTAPLMKFMGINSCCRISFGIYNDSNDIDRLIEGLIKVKEVFNL